MKTIFFITFVSGVVATGYADIKTVVGLTLASYEDRYRQTYQIGRVLSAEDRKALEAFLMRPPKDDTLAIDELAALKNNVADALIAQAGMPEATLDLFLVTYRDPVLGERWHGYVVQKIAELVQRLKSPEKIQQAVDFLWSQLEPHGGRYPAEAALGLGRLQAVRPDWVAVDELTQRLNAFLVAKDADQQEKRVVLEVLARYDLTTARGEARRFLARPNSDIMLKAAAIATLGLAGNAEDRPLVEPYVNSPDIRLSQAASGAMRALNK